MKISPQDLGPTLEPMILRFRMDRIEGSVNNLVRFIQKGAYGQEAFPKSITVASAATLFALKRIPKLIWLGGLLSFIISILVNLNVDSLEMSSRLMLSIPALGMVASGISGFLYHRQRCRMALLVVLSRDEIEMLVHNSSDPLTQEYIRTVAVFIAMPAPREAQSLIHIRRSMALLGEAVTNLPMQPADGMQVDPKQLEQQSAADAAQAQTETDQIISASLERRSRTLAQRAEVIQRTQVITRRNQFLREEIAGQIKALRTSVEAAQLSGSDCSLDFSELAAGIAEVAQETASIAMAQAELEDAAVPAFIQQKV